jgi:hypothetical protein
LAVVLSWFSSRRLATLSWVRAASQLDVNLLEIKRGLLPLKAPFVAPAFPLRVQRGNSGIVACLRALHVEHAA